MIVQKTLWFIVAIVVCGSSFASNETSQAPAEIQQPWPDDLVIGLDEAGKLAVLEKQPGTPEPAGLENTPSSPGLALGSSSPLDGTLILEETLPSTQSLPPVEGLPPSPPPSPIPMAENLPPLTTPMVDHSGLTGGAALLLLAPYQQGSEAYAINTGLAAPSTTADQSVESFGSSVQAAPLLWLGWQFDGESGVRTRFFWFNALSAPVSLAFDPDQPVASSSSLSPPPGLAKLPGQQQFLSPGNSVLFVGGNTSTATFSSYVRIYSIDLEYTRERRGRWLDSLFTAGGRYLNVDQTYTAFASATGIDQVSGDTKYETQSLAAMQNFSGGGPTISWLGRLPLGETRLNAYGGVRGSLLAGTYTDRVNFVDNDFNVTSGRLENTNGSAVNAVAFGVLPVGELESGLEYDGTIGSRRWFTRLGVVAIDYFGLGAANGSAGDLLLLGGEVAAGIRY